MAIIISKDGRNAKKIERTTFRNEDHLQKYLHDNPECIPLYDIKVDTQLLILAREFPTNSGAMDAIGVDKDGDVYCIETKLYKNPDKRHVVAQVLDYGASLWHSHLEFDQFIRRIEESVRKSSGMTLDQRLSEFFALEQEAVSSLLDNVKANLNTGKFKFVVLMDKLEDDLKNLVAFLNYNSRFDIFAVEMDFYSYEDYGIMIPKIFGAEAKKDIAVSSSRNERWTEDRFMAKLAESQGADANKAAIKLLTWGNVPPRFNSWGVGKETGSFTPQIKRAGKFYQFFNVITDGKIILPFGGYQVKPPFDSIEKRRELLTRLNSFLGIRIPDDSISGYPTFPFATLADESVFNKFTAVFEWVSKEIEAV